MNEKSIAAGDPVGLHTLEVIAEADRFNDWLFSQFKHLLKGKILEIGSGIGNLSQVVINNGMFLTLSDYNTAYYDWLKKKFAGNKQVEDVFQIDLIHPRFKDEYSILKEQFDSIFLLNVIEHIKDDAKAIEHCKFLLKPSGHLIVLAPAWQWLFCRLDKELGHYRRYSLKKMKTLISDSGLTIIKKEYFNFLGVFGWVVFGIIFRSRMLGKKEMSAFNKLVLPAKILDRIVFKKAGLSVIVAGRK